MDERALRALAFPTGKQRQYGSVFPFSGRCRLVCSRDDRENTLSMRPAVRRPSGRSQAATVFLLLLALLSLFPPPPPLCDEEASPSDALRFPPPLGRTAAAPAAAILVAVMMAC